MHFNTQSRIRNEFFSRNKNVFLSYGVAFFILLAVYVILGIYPFGDYTIIKVDLFHSYAPVFNDMRTKLLSGKSVIYSWNAGMGANLFSSILLQAVSPFSLLVFLFPTEYITEFFALLFLVKIPFSAMTFFIYAREKFQKDDLSVVCFSILYALCGYVTAFHWNQMFLDAVILLPLVALGLERLLLQKKSALYCVSLASAIFLNYGIAIFLCYFSVLYFLMNLLIYRDKLAKKERHERIIIFATRSLLAGTVCAIVLLPCAVMLRESTYLNEAFPRKIEFYNSYNGFGKFYTNHFFGMHPTVLVFSNSVANIYSGVLTVILLPFYFLNKSIKLKDKLLYFTFAAILFLCCQVNILAFIVHGLHFPAMIPHRFSFIYSFLLIVMAFQAWNGIENIKLKHYILFFIAFIASLIAVYLIYPQTKVLKPGKMSPEAFVINLILVTVYFGIIVLYKYRKNAKERLIITVLTLIIVIIEITANSSIYIGHLGDGQRNAYVREFYEPMTEVSKSLYESTAFYRAEFKHHRSYTDGRLYNYNGVNAFTFLPDSVTNFLDKIGISAAGNKITLINPTPLLNSILGVKYLFNKGSTMDDTFTLFEFKEQKDSIYVYENPYVLPLGFMVNDEIQNLDTDAFENPFMLQNDFVRKAAGVEAAMFSEVSAEQMVAKYMQLTDIDVENTVFYEIYDYVTPEMEPTITYTITAPESKWMYAILRTGGATAAHVKVNGEGILYQHFRGPSSGLDAGFVNKGDIVEIVIFMDKLSEDEEQELIRTGTVRLDMAQMDFELYQEVISKLGEEPLNVTYYDETTVIGKVSAEKEGILFTSIPYDTGWSVSVDGKDIPYRAIGGGVIGVKIYPGEHDIQFSYRQQGLLPGAIVSAISLIIMISLFIGESRKRKKTDDNESVETAN